MKNGVHHSTVELEIAFLPREGNGCMDLLADAANLGIWIWPVHSDYVRLSHKCRELFAFRTNESVTFDACLGRVHPEDREAFENGLQRAIPKAPTYQAEYRLLLPDGSLKYVSASGRVERDRSGKALRVLAVCIDISEWRRAEEAARELSGRFITAQEDERRRIARDLHDDLNQRLALLSVEMDLFGQMLTSHRHPPTDVWERLAGHVKEISSEVHKLSYELHPAKLDQLGLVAAARAFCQESSRRSAVRVDFVHHDVPLDLSLDIALCLYRVLQESLQNVLRHSGANAARAELSRHGKTLRLVVADLGKGFDFKRARQSGGLGLVSMEERLRLVHGSVAVQTNPGHGARLEFNVPL